jgi:phytoene synthase
MPTGRSLNMHSAIPDEDADYCRRQVTLGDDDFFLSLNYAPNGDLARVAALFAFQIELRRIPSLVSEPPLGEVRLQWWREAVDEVVAGKAVRAHPVVRSLAATGAINAGSRDVAERRIDGRARALYEPRFSTLEGAREFLRGAEAPLVALALGDSASISNDATSNLGEAYALARFAPMIAPHLASEAATAAMRLLQEEAANLSLSASEAGRVAFLALTRGYAARTDGRPWPLVKRISIFRAALTGRF